MTEYTLTDKQRQECDLAGYVNITRGGKQIRVTPSMVKSPSRHLPITSSKRSATFVGLFKKGRETPDKIDEGLAKKFLAEWDRIKNPRVGDYIIMPSGKYERFAHDWGDGLQTTPGGSFNIGDGFVSCSGGLNHTVSINRIKKTSQRKTGYFWIFHHGYPGAGSGVGVSALCRVYKHQ